MDIHIASNNLCDSLPQGFSVYQPILGSPLQFFPAMGTKELDDMLHSYLPGPAPIADKRAAVSVDFLEHLHLTGQAFKFYQIEAPATVPSASASSSPESASGASSMSGFPATPTWDFNSITFTQSSTSSQTSSSALKTRKSAKAASASRHQATDFSHLPGMKIMTKDGIDVTNAASRGSKTKEQRDHAHLMRIIKACDSCRAKKIRCDPSHKRRAASTASSSSTPAPLPPSNYRARRQRTISKLAQPASSQPQPSLTWTLAPTSEFNWDDFDASMEMVGLDCFDDLQEPWSEFMHFPDNDSCLQDAHTIGSEGNASPLSSLTPTTTSSEFVTKPHSPSDAFKSGDTTTSDQVVTNRSPLADNNRDTWLQHELDLATNRDSSLLNRHSQHPVVVDDGLRPAAPSDSLRISGDHGLDATLLSSTDTILSQHHLEDPGTFANTALSAQVSDNVISSSVSPTSSSLEAIPSAASETIGTHTVLGQDSPAGRLITETSLTVHGPSQRLCRAIAAVAEMAPISMQTQSQSLAIAGNCDSHLGLFSLSEPTVSGPAQPMRGGNSELIATSTTLASRSLAEFFAAVALVAISFVSSVDNLFVHDYPPSRGLLDRRPPRPQAAVVSSQQSRRMPIVSPVLAMAPIIAGVC